MMVETLDARYPMRQNLKVLKHRASVNFLDRETWERRYLEQIIGAVKPGDVVFDIGAEEGEYPALLAKDIGSQGLHLFEPAPWYWPNIKAVWEANGLAPPAGCWQGFAADMSRGDTQPVLSEWPTQAAGPLFLESAFACYAEHPHIDAITIDDYVARTGAVPSYILCDVEGAEGRVITGAQETIVAHRPQWFMAIHPRFVERYGATRRSILETMQRLGYFASLISIERHEEHWTFIP